MLAFGLTILVFVFWTGVGYSVLTLLYRQNHLLQNALLAPVVGMATTLLPVFWINRLGVPVGQFGIGLTIVLVLGSAGVFWFVRPKFPWRDYLPFAIVFVVALFLTGRPMLEFGFNWASFSNQDLSYYSLSAHRYLNHGYFDHPTLDYAGRKDYTFTYWFLQVNGHRTGSELLLAWLISLTRLAAPSIYMSLILTFHLVLISSAGALTYQAKSFRSIALITCGFLSMSAQVSLGTLYQLLAQVSGIGLLAGCGALTMQPFKLLNFQNLLRLGALISIVLSALLITYSESFPFLAASLSLYLIIGVIQKRLNIKAITYTFITIFLFNLVFLNSYLLDIVRFYLLTSSRLTKPLDLQESIFPYYLVPSGLANLWGLQGITDRPSEPLLSITIVFGALLLLAAVILTTVMLRSGLPIVMLSAVMLMVGLLLSVRRNDFGLFKLAMFIQPFLIGSLVTALLVKSRRKFLLSLPVIMLGIINLHTQFTYINVSRGESGLSEIPNASATELYSDLEKIISSSGKEQIILDSSNISLVGLQSIYSRGKVALIPTFNRLSTTAGEQVVDAIRGSKQGNGRNSFDLHTEGIHPTANSFTEEEPLEKLVFANKNALLITTTSAQSLFNRWHSYSGDDENIYVRKLADVNNHLIFISSKLGGHYFVGADFYSLSGASFYQLESDYFSPNYTMAGIGRYFLFRVLNPSGKGRVVVDVTTSLKGDGRNILPPATVIGNQRSKLSLIGRGSARVFSQSVETQLISNSPYLGIDMGVDGQPDQYKRDGLMSFYGSDVPIDRRKLVAYARDISFISDQQYAQLSPPSSLNSLPRDLYNRNLEYSGVYEDGWLSEAAFFGLSQPNSATPLSIRGTVPGLSDSKFVTEMRVLVDGKEVAQRTLKPGEFNLKLTLPKAQKRRRVDLRFSKWQNLPNPDKRPVAAKLSLIGFTTDEKS